VTIVEPDFFHTQLFAHATSSADVARATMPYPGNPPLRTSVGIDMGVRALNDATKDIGPNTLAAGPFAFTGRTHGGGNSAIVER
jgi:hypothetical protein